MWRSPVFPRGRSPLVVWVLSSLVASGGAACDQGGGTTGSTDPDEAGAETESSASDATADGTSDTGEGSVSGSNDASEVGTEAGADSETADTSDNESGSASSGDTDEFAQVLKVEVTGSSGDYRFAVTVLSPDTGCDDFANWWEVLSPEGELIYRRILRHSHVEEQPFTREGGPIDVAHDQELIVRAFQHSAGYGVQAMRGSVDGGFASVELPDFAHKVADLPPQPGECPY